MREAEDFRRWARHALRGKWPEAILAGIVMGLLGGSGGISFTTSNLNRFLTDLFNYNHSLTGLYILLACSIASIVLAIVIGGVLQMGYCLFNLNLVDGKTAQVTDLFSQFRRIGTGVRMVLCTTFLVLLWSLLLIIPGIIASYSYAMTPYILAENPECGVIDSIDRSKEMMKGNKMRLFILNLSFIGWIILGALTCGLGMLAVSPYMQAATAAFYREVSAQTPQE